MINIYPTLKVFQAHGKQDTGRLKKLMIIWLLPVLGELIISLYFLLKEANGGGPYDAAMVTLMAETEPQHR